MCMYIYIYIYIHLRSAGRVGMILISMMLINSMILINLYMNMI